MATHVFQVYEVDEAYYFEGDGQILAEDTFTINDDGQILRNKDENACNQLLMSLASGCPISAYHIDYDDIISVADASGRYHVITFYITDNQGQDRSYILSKDAGFPARPGDILKSAGSDDYREIRYDEIRQTPSA